jgi:integrase/recombinase XerD
MLTVYRRHSSDCQHFGKPRNARGSRGCACPIWVQGSLRGEYLRKSLNLTSWEAASDLVRGWEASGEIGVVKPQVPSVAEAISRFFEDAAARGLKLATISKYRVLLEKQMLPWCRAQGYTRLKQLGVDELTRFRATWPDSPLSMRKKQERLAAFFHFCRVRSWVGTNPILSIKLPEVTPNPTLPFSRESMKKILDGCDEFPIKGIYGEGNRKRLKAMIWLLRFTGLRIRDGVTITRDRIRDGRVFLYTQKTGTPVHVPVPPFVVAALEDVPKIHDEYVFWSGKGDPKSAVADWQRSFRRLLDLVGVKGHFHMLRDTAAVEWLLGGVPLETVSVLLGHKDVKTTLEHYRPWVRRLQQKLEVDVRRSWNEKAPRSKSSSARHRKTGSRRAGPHEVNRGGAPLPGQVRGERPDLRGPADIPAGL